MQARQDASDGGTRRGSKAKAGGRRTDGDALAADVANLGYEDALAELESIIERIEQGEVGLERTLEEYRRGRALLQRCRGILDGAEDDIRRMSLADVEALARRGADQAAPSADDLDGDDDER
jgi:exodeoxyribonuclease VII small subunit